MPVANLCPHSKYLLTRKAAPSNKVKVKKIILVAPYILDSPELPGLKNMVDFELADNLHEFADGDAERLDLLRRVFVRAREIIANFGDARPFTYLEDHINIKTLCHTQDLPTETLTDAIDCVLGMFSDN